MKHKWLWRGFLIMLPFISMAACVKAKQGTAPGALLVVSFGTSYPETRVKTIDALETALSQSAPERQLRRAWTSKIIISKLKKRDGISIDTVPEALVKLQKEGADDLVLQPTLIIKGIEYDDIMNDVRAFVPKFKTIRYGAPLLSADRDFEELFDVLSAETSRYLDGATAVVFMGHGSEHDSNEAYLRLDEMFITRGLGHVVIGTVEAEPSLENALERVAALGVKHVVLLPLMIVAGDHAANDMAGDDDDSWKSVFQAQGYTVNPVLRGLGEYPGVQRIFARHLQEALAGRPADA